MAQTLDLSSGFMEGEAALRAEVSRHHGSLVPPCSPRLWLP